MKRYFKIFQNTFCLSAKITAESFLIQEPTSCFGSIDSGLQLPKNSLETMHILQTLFALRELTKEWQIEVLVIFKQLMRSELLHLLDQDSFCKPEKLV